MKVRCLFEKRKMMQFVQKKINMRTEVVSNTNQEDVFKQNISYNPI